MKTTKINYALCIAVMISFSACNSFLDEPEPQQALPTENAFTTAKDIKNALIGAYSGAKLPGFFGCNVVMCSDLLADNGVYRGAFPEYGEIYNHKMQPNNSQIGAMWRDGYRIINQANLVLEAIQQINDPALTAELANQYRGEALFLRAAAHFELVRFFGLPYGESSSLHPGVPLMLQATVGEEDITFPSRNTVEDVYEQAISDLMEAKDILPDKTDNGRANRFTAIGYLAEIHFQMRDYVSAADYAEQVIEGPYTLTSSPEDFFINEGSDEEIWCIKETPTDNPGRNASLASFHSVNSTGAVVVSQDLDTNGFDKIIPDFQANAIIQDSLMYKDLRFDNLTSNRLPPTINVEKYEDYTLNSDDAPIQRLAEFILMLAEALVMTNGKNQESIDLLNEIRVRSIRVFMPDGTPALNGADYIKYSIENFPDSAALIEAIILERRVELCFEGNRFHDLCRLQRDVHGLPYSDPNLRFPIPQREMDINPNLEQNEGYK